MGVNNYKYKRKGEVLIGDRFGLLTVLNNTVKIKITPTNKKVYTIQLKCDCGNIVDICKNRLKSGNVRSCGCLHKQVVTTQGGLKHTKAYSAWRGVISRCHSEADQAYPFYGARGIYVCDRWRTSILNFIEDMGEKPSTKHSLDRIENDKGYYKENCRWATKEEQSRNKRGLKWITHNKLTFIQGDWAKMLGISKQYLSEKLKKGIPFSEIYNYYITI